MLKIALISLYGIENNGIRTISAVLNEKGFDTHIIFFKRWVNNDICLPTEQEKKALISLLRELKVELVGIGFVSPFLKIAQELTRAIKNNLQVRVVWGGVHATVKPEDCLEYCDIVCRGEGEYAIFELAEACAKKIPLIGIKNTCYKRGEKIVFEKMRPLIGDLDSLPYQEYGGKNKHFIENGICNIDPLINALELRVFASRGCPFNCAYCYNSIFRQLYPNEKYHRIKSVKRVISEIEYALSKLRGIKKIKFDDDTFVFPKDWINEFCQQYKNCVGLPFEILFNAECLDEEIMGLLKGAGLRRVQIGVQTGSPKESKEIYNRNLSLEKIRQAAYVARKFKVEVVYDVILDNPVETGESKKALIDFLLSLPRPFDLFIYSLTIFPGTRICESFLRQGLIKDEDIEGQANKSFNQFRLSFSYPRSKEELFTACIVSLVSKSFVPKRLIYFLKDNNALRKHPYLLEWFAQFCNLTKLIGIFLRMLMRKEVNIYKFKEYGFPKRFLIQ